MLASEIAGIHNAIMAQISLLSRTTTIMEQDSAQRTLSSLIRMMDGLVERLVNYRIGKIVRYESSALMHSAERAANKLLRTLVILGDALARLQARAKRGYRARKTCTGGDHSHSENGPRRLLRERSVGQRGGFFKWRCDACLSLIAIYRLTR
jgi:hypothetical protein